MWPKAPPIVWVASSVLSCYAGNEKGEFAMDRWKYSARCNVLLPSTNSDLLCLKGKVYEVLAPGTSIVESATEVLVWRGLYRARETNLGLRS